MAGAVRHARRDRVSQLARNAMPGMGGHDEKEQTLNPLLVELDGFDATSGRSLSDDEG